MTSLSFTKLTSLVILVLFLASCFESQGPGSVKRVKEGFVENQSQAAHDFIKNLIQKKNESNVNSYLGDEFKFYLSNPLETKLLAKNKDSFLKLKEQYFPSAIKKWKIDGFIGQPPWYAYDIHVQRGDEVYGRFCVLNLLKDKINFMQCYIEAREHNDHFAGKVALQDRNELYAMARQKSTDYNNHNESSCSNPKSKSGTEVFKYYPTRVDQVGSKKDNDCRKMSAYFEEADPSILKTRVWVHDPWVMDDILFSSSYKPVHRIGLYKFKVSETEMIHQYIPIEGQLFREFILNVEIPEKVGKIFPPQLDSALTKMIARAQFEPLFRLDKKGKIEPLVATSFQWGPNRKRLTININPMTRFSDGTYLEAKDLKSSWYSVFKVNEIRKTNPYNRFFREIRGMDKAYASDKFHGVEIVSDKKLIIYFEKKQEEFPKVLASPVMSPFKQKGSRVLGTGPFKVVENEAPYDHVVLWPNNLHAESEQFASLRFINQKSKNKKLKGYPIDLKFETTNEDSTRCSVKDPSWRCLRLYFDFPEEKAGWTAEFNTSKLSPNKAAWSENPEQFFRFASRQRINLEPLKKSKNY